MSNVLKVSLQTTIYSLADRGWSQRRIASELGINRETVRRYLRLAKPAISTAGSEEGADRNPAISITGKQAEHADSKPAISIAGLGAGRRSRCEWLAEVISAKLEAGLSARRIYQDLVEQNGFRDSYQSVQRFVRKLKATQPQRVWRMEARPGEGNFRAFQFSYSNNAIRNVTLTMFVTSTLFVTAASISNLA
jgi:predicted transcriptional regulator